MFELPFLFDFFEKLKKCSFKILADNMLINEITLLAFQKDQNNYN